ncbi:MAG: hypothetical protein AAF432_03820 [Planctomycetota bacterium]
MKTLWNMVSVLAVANLLALGIFVGWLWKTERLTVDRLRDMRSMMMMTAEEEALAAAEKATLDAVAMDEAAARARKSNPPLPSGVLINQQQDASMTDAQIVRRLEDEKNMLVQQLQLKTRQIEQERESFEKERTAWQNATESERQQRSDTQFAKVVSLYESIPAKQAKEMLTNLVDDDATAQAVAYLNAMQPRAAAKIIKELKTDVENQLATDLLENLRTYGIAAEVTEPATNEPVADNPADPATNTGF